MPHCSCQVTHSSMLPSSPNGTHLPHGQYSRYLASLSVECLTTMEGTRLKTPTHLGKHHPSTLNQAQTRPADPRDVLNRTGSQPQSHELTMPALVVSAPVRLRSLLASSGPTSSAATFTRPGAELPSNCIPTEESSQRRARLPKTYQLHRGAGVDPDNKNST